MTSQDIEKRLRERFTDAVISVVDLTGGGDHYEVDIQSGAFKNISRINQHKLVMSVFDVELKSGELHAFSIKTRSL